MEAKQAQWQYGQQVELQIPGLPKDVTMPVTYIGNDPASGRAWIRHCDNAAQLVNYELLRSV